MRVKSLYLLIFIFCILALSSSTVHPFSLRDIVDDARDSVSDFVDDSIDDIKDRVDEEIDSAVDDVKDRVDEEIDSAVDDVKDRVDEEIDSATDDLEDYIEEQTDNASEDLINAIKSADGFDFEWISSTPNLSIPEPITFTIFISGGVPPYTVQLDFGDSTVSTETVYQREHSILHTFNEAKAFTTTITIADANNLTLPEDSLVVDLSEAVASTTLYAVSGKVINTSDSAPIAGATVSAGDDSAFTSLDDGSFALLLPAGSYSIVADKNGVTSSPNTVLVPENTDNQVIILTVDSYTVPAALLPVSSLSISSDDATRSLTVDWTGYFEGLSTTDQSNLVHYKVYYSLTPFTGVAEDGVTLAGVVGSSEQTLTISRLPNLQQYYFVVTPLDIYNQEPKTSLAPTSFFLAFVPSFSVTAALLTIFFVVIVFRKRQLQTCIHLS